MSFKRSRPSAFEVSHPGETSERPAPEPSPDVQKRKRTAEAYYSPPSRLPIFDEPVDLVGEDDSSQNVRALYNFSIFDGDAEVGCPMVCLSELDNPQGPIRKIRAAGYVSDVLLDEDEGQEDDDSAPQFCELSLILRTTFDPQKADE